MSRITADEARKLSGPSVQDRVDSVYLLIRESAAKGGRHINLHDDFWARGGYSGKPDWKQACEILRKDGFTVDFFYEERQFVDMYTVVKW